VVGATSGRRIGTRIERGDSSGIRSRPTGGPTRAASWSGDRPAHSDSEKAFHATQRFPRFYADRVVGGDRDHRGPDRPPVAGGAGGPRGRPDAPAYHPNEKTRA